MEGHRNNGCDMKDSNSLNGSTDTSLKGSIPRDGGCFRLLWDCSPWWEDDAEKQTVGIVLDPGFESCPCVLSQTMQPQKPQRTQVVRDMKILRRSDMLIGYHRGSVIAMGLQT